MGWINLDELRGDLLAEVIVCDFCFKKYERRYFAEVADGEDIDFNRCQDCRQIQDDIDAIEECQCQNGQKTDLQTIQENIAFAQELYERHGE